MVNYVAILVCGIAAMIIGSIWHGPLFGKAQMEVMGAPEMTPERKEEMKKKMWGMYFVQFVLALIQAWALDQVILHWAGMAGAVEIAIFVWFGFTVTVMGGGALWSGKPKKLSWKMFWIGIGNELVTFIAFALILNAWK
ncbi:MAG TPA: DUF1761 domain-containing protein [Candidatus Paceibacterota bacterium]|jgi:hypothetical protein|nr:DUF1761 domain-containing protein [Candidatus Paceibacterota bacterium]